MSEGSRCAHTNYVKKYVNIAVVMYKKMYCMINTACEGNSSNTDWKWTVGTDLKNLVLSNLCSKNQGFVNPKISVIVFCEKQVTLLYLAI